MSKWELEDTLCRIEEHLLESKEELDDALEIIGDEENYLGDDMYEDLTCALKALEDACETVGERIAMIQADEERAMARDSYNW